MTWLAHKLNKRVQILKPVQRPNEGNGSLDFGFGQAVGAGFNLTEFSYLEPLKTVWMSLNPITFKGAGTQYVRGEQVGKGVTHQFKVRYLEVSSIGKEFSAAYDNSFKTMADLNNPKTTYFLQYNHYSKQKGRLFKIRTVTNDRENDEFLVINAEEIEERGTGFGP